MEETDLAVIPKEDFDELINKNPEITKKFIQLLAKSISEKEDHLLAIAYNSLRKKVADSLLILQQKYQKKKEENFVIDISRESLATIAGTATESLIRTLSDFRNEKILEIKNGSIIIINQKKLESLAN
jgi:CRP-like cAMP-binding protein